jgi:hypothetical protein
LDTGAGLHALDKRKYLAFLGIISDFSAAQPVALLYFD